MSNCRVDARRQTRHSLGLLVIMFAINFGSAEAQILDVVHRFHTSGDPEGRLILASDGYLYGTTKAGGNGFGTIYKMDTLGNLTIVHSFSSTDGATPEPAVVQAVDGNLYGVATGGGTSNLGVVYRMDLAGNLTVLHHFGGLDGAQPDASLIQASDGNLYGTTLSGGIFGQGTIFRIDLAGNLTTLYSFSGADGATPWAALVEGTDGNFYGTTFAGGNGYGSVFKISAAGTLTTLYSFGSSEGRTPRAALVQATDGNFYGTTLPTGLCDQCTDYGNVFKIDSSGNFSVVHEFAYPEGRNPYGGLIQASDGNLYGTLYSAAPDCSFYPDPASVFGVDPSTGNLWTVWSFQDGCGTPGPVAGLLQTSDGSFYGTTQGGGAYGLGQIFRIDSSGEASLYSFAEPGGMSPKAGLIQAPDGTLLGTTHDGGASGAGTIFRVDASGAFSTLHAFTGPDGAGPAATLFRALDGFFYGSTQGGGAGGDGTVFKMDSSGSPTTIHSFVGDDGFGPTAALIQAADGDLFGTSRARNTSAPGTVFRFDSSLAFSTVHTFNAFDGSGQGIDPVARLVQAGNGFFYGTTSGDYGDGSGTVYKMDSAGNLTVLHTFTDSEGSYPNALVQGSDGYLYGTALFSGPGSGPGTLFRTDAAGNFTTLHSFNGSDGSNPSGDLIQRPDGYFYGTTSTGGANDAGTIFKVDTSGNLTTLFSFSPANGSGSSSGLFPAADGSLWGTTPGGGFGQGVVFRLILGDPTLEVSSTNPTSGPSGGGTPIQVAGSGFVTGARVMIGNTPAEGVTVAGSESVNAAAPVLPPGTLNDVTVINSDSSFGTGVKLWLSDFSDVPRTDGFHDDVEKIFRHGITAGCGNGNYCRNDAVRRDQMAVFLLKAEHGSTYSPPACSGTFPDVPCPGPFTNWVEQLAAEQITSGCGGGDYCAASSVTRAQVAVFLLRTEHGSSYTPPPCSGMFGDVACPSQFADWIEQLAVENVTGGCGGGNYCPGHAVTRGQMGVFLVKTFGLQ